MNNALFGDTITAYHLSGETWTRTILKGVQWKTRTERVNENGRNSLKNIVSITIPNGVEGADRLTADGNTVIVLGIGKPIEGSYTIKNLRGEHAATYCTVRAISDNTLRPMLQHWKVTAE